MVQRTTLVDLSPGYYEKRVQSGGDTPRHRRRKGLWGNNNYSTTTLAYARKYSNMVYSDGKAISPPLRYSTNSFYNVSVSPIVWPAETDVLSKLAGKWRNTDLNLGMYLSPEGKESVSMMASSLTKFTNATRQLRRGDFGGFLRNLNELPRSARRASARKFNQGDLSGSFLAAHLGWEPLIKDIYTASQGVDDIPSSTRRITSRRTGPNRAVSVGTAGNPVPSARKLQSSQKTQVRLILDITKPPTFAQRFGLDNPFLIAWELVPLSFVADYFLPIGSVIDNLGFISGVWGQKGWRKAYAKVEYKTWVEPMTLLGRYSNGKLYYNRDEISTTLTEWQASRTVWSPSFGDPFRSISTKLPTSLMKLSTLAALAHQNVLSLSRRTS